MERPHNNRFLEQDSGSSFGMVGWAVRHLVMWVLAGLIVYSLLSRHLLFGGGGSDDVAPIARPSPVAHEAPRASGGSVFAVNSLTLQARSDGHVLTTAEINGVPIHFIVDTGATWVSLSEDDAARAGVAGGLDFSTAMSTANGVAKGAQITLRSVRIDQLEVDDVPAMVMPDQKGISLLGQSFLNRLQSYEMRGGVLTLTW